MGRSPKAFMERRLKACTRNRLTSASGKLIAQKRVLGTCGARRAGGRCARDFQIRTFASAKTR